MKRTTKTLLLSTIAIVAIVASFIAVVPAQDTVTTEVTIASGGGNLPVVKCKWEQDLTLELEDGDPDHNDPGSAFLPPCEYQGKKTVQYWAVVTDEEDGGDVMQVNADVYHPDGSFKYQVPMEKMPKPDAIAVFEAAYLAGLVTFDPAFDYDEVMFELDKCTADVWMGVADLDYHQPAGDYRADIQAIDRQSNPSPILSNMFLYVPMDCCEIDFEGVNYGSVSICQNKWKAGDTNFEPPASANPTIRNIGNIPVSIEITQDDMGFGQNVNGEWEVEFDARLGSNIANAVYYEPLETVRLPNALPLCNTEELDFSIHVKKGLSGGVYAGQMTIDCLPA